MKYKAIFIDVDGTLVKNYTDALPSPRVTQAIAKAREKGLHVGLVTGRPLEFLGEIFDHLQLVGPSVITNGAQVIDSITKKVLWQQSILPQDFENALEIVKKFSSEFIVTEDGINVAYAKGGEYKAPLIILVEHMPPKKADEMMRQLNRISTITTGKYISPFEKSDEVWISHVAATKQHGMVEALEILHISPEEVIGIGDGYNDFSLMMVSGLKVAMGNAIEDLKDIADYVAPTVDEDGVADVIEKFILTS